MAAKLVCEILKTNQPNPNMKLYIFGNGNIKFTDFENLYLNPVKQLLQTNNNVEFLVCDFCGVDTLVMEYLKTESSQVHIFHIGEKPRYLPDKYKTKVSQWKIKGGFDDDLSRDEAAIEACTHFLAIDFNSNEKRKSGTQRNIERCLALGKILIDGKHRT